MSRLIESLPRATHTLKAGVTKLLQEPRPYGWEVGSARWKYQELNLQGGVDATRFGDWEYSGRCTDF